MKKLVITTSLLLLTSLTVLNAKSVYTDEYQLHSDIYNKSINITNATKKELFFGLKKDYFEKMEKIYDEAGMIPGGVMGAISGGSSQAANLAKGALSAGIQGIGLGMVVGVAFNSLDNYMKEKKRTAEWIYVVEFTNEKGEKTNGAVLLSSIEEDFKSEPKLEKIIEIMKKGF